MAKAQTFYLDMFVGIGIFVAAVILFIALSSNEQPEESAFEFLVGTAEAISSSLVSPGEPEDWTADNVQQLGIVEGLYLLNGTKARALMTMNPVNASILFGANSNYAVFFEDKDGNILNFGNCTLNNAGFAVQNLTPSLCENFTITPQQHLVSVERLAMHNFSIIKIVIHTWI
ncbi:hypothetical protein JXB11_02915 [Candidatus Woesearchaeota archaeon]|nr:hypothetical protein [Candidatus Woesearchaeota archaeon]